MPEPLPPRYPPGSGPPSSADLPVFDPTKVERWDVSDEGYMFAETDGRLFEGAGLFVSSSDYDRLLALYKKAQNSDGAKLAGRKVFGQ